MMSTQQLNDDWQTFRSIWCTWRKGYALGEDWLEFWRYGIGREHWTPPMEARESGYGGA